MGSRIVFTGFVADELIAAGEQLLHIRPDLKDITRNVFVFKDSVTFQDSFNTAVQLQLTEQGKEIYK